MRLNIISVTKACIVRKNLYINDNDVTCLYSVAMLSYCNDVSIRRVYSATAASHSTKKANNDFLFHFRRHRWKRFRL